MEKLNEKCLVIFSGGQDSTTCLGLALAQYREVHAVSFYYGQKHAIELVQAEKICYKHNVQHYRIDISFLKNVTDSALVSDKSVNEQHERFKDLPASYVPNRNALLIVISHTLAQKIEASVIYAGMNQEDYSGYPDCREEFLKAISNALALSSMQIPLNTPLLHLKKYEIFALAQKVGFLKTVLEDSHTCYNGDHNTSHEWGYGCGHCPACQVRKKGFIDFIEKKREI
jgi:7-cyano-7-deazaguanine synthase